MPLVHYFETSFGRTVVRRIVLVRVSSEGLTGYGECTAGEGPWYSYETTDTAWHILKSFLVPVVLRTEYEGASAVSNSFGAIRGHQMAKASLETAIWDLAARLGNIPLYQYLGGTRRQIACGVSIGIQESIEVLLEKIEKELSAGYQRIKVKIKPGWDTQILRSIRSRFPKILLMGDANSAYSLADAAHLESFDQFNLMMIEQPLSFNDIVDHSRLQTRLKTPICLDESIRDSSDARKAVEMGSCRIINVKLGRVGGYSEARKLSQYCLAQKIPLWCGGMLEAGIGRAHNIALSTLPSFVLPGDVSASHRYFEQDIIQPPVEVDGRGFIHVPERPGIGYTPDLDRIDALTVRKTELRA